MSTRLGGSGPPGEAAVGTRDPALAHRCPLAQPLEFTMAAGTPAQPTRPHVRPSLPQEPLNPRGADRLLQQESAQVHRGCEGLEPGGPRQAGTH